MHRTTRAALLVSLTITAVSGCVAVQTPAAPSATTPGPASAPAPKGGAQPQIVQAPAHEALERIQDEQRERAREAVAVPQRTKPRAVRESGAAKAPAAGDGREHPKAPVEVPEAPAPSADVCDLGEQYGGWPADSPQAQICRSTYGG